ncbi:hypothetical protein CONLIGDRAFT_686801 [Coniochaeta ligniaria NRRL 30616]|uniref:Uncharacterized protein n=1 Tax=Coniochaeta ligniaria NRRL 30616 TaxID=1408157 RepID=A0A1J7I7G3_9PEZI|nr:hypothetical protein CONLIGDRAFT_686801 [Coniochaeta ligniaria NRRL 30616]
MHPRKPPAKRRGAATVQPPPAPSPDPASPSKPAPIPQLQQFLIPVAFFIFVLVITCTIRSAASPSGSDGHLISPSTSTTTPSPNPIPNSEPVNQLTPTPKAPKVTLPPEPNTPRSKICTTYTHLSHHPPLYLSTTTASPPPTLFALFGVDINSGVPFFNASPPGQRPQPRELESFEWRTFVSDHFDAALRGLRKGSGGWGGENGGDEGPETKEREEDRGRRMSLVYGYNVLHEVGSATEYVNFFLVWTEEKRLGGLGGRGRGRWEGVGRGRLGRLCPGLEGG